MDRVLSRLRDRGFCNDKFKPIAKLPYSVLSLSEIIDKYNAIIRGTANYYIPSIDTFNSFTRVQYILEYSCYGTLAKKYNSSIFKLFRKYGKPPVFKIEATITSKSNIKIDVPEIKPKVKFINSYLTNKANALKIKENPELQKFVNSDIFQPMNRVNWRTYKNLNCFWIICGSTENIQWHHEKSIRIGKVSGFRQVMNQLNRRQAPLCPIHHREVEQGKYDNIKLSDLIQVEYWIA